jgi:transcriptional repressor NrdR
MKCPFCHHADTQVLETRDLDDAVSIKRRRRCISCFRRFTTIERAALDLPLIVKRDGTRVDFDRQKIKNSMLLSLRKRPFDMETVDSAILNIEQHLMMVGDKEVASDQIGERVMEALKKIDQIAYVRFASVYRSFQDVQDFASAALEAQQPKDENNSSEKMNG